MADHTGIATKNTVAAQHRTTGDGRKCCHSRVIAYNAVVSYLHMIIYNHHIADQCVTQSTAINGSAGANLNIIAQPDTTNLVYFLPATLAIGRKPKTIGTNRDRWRHWQPAGSSHLKPNQRQ